jgi:hypothetical protein
MSPASRERANALLGACMDSDLASLKALLALKADVNYQDAVRTGREAARQAGRDSIRRGSLSSGSVSGLHQQHHQQQQQ